MDISGESEATRSSTGWMQITEDMGWNCLIARRMLERGVRFVRSGAARTAFPAQLG